MTLAQISDLSQIFGVFGMLASLVFVGLQIRQNTRATKAQTQEYVAGSWHAMGQMIADHAAAFGAGLRSVDKLFADLSNEDTIKFMACINAYFKHYENMFLQYSNGFINKDVWLPWSIHMQIFFHQPGDPFLPLADSLESQFPSIREDK